MPTEQVTVQVPKTAPEFEALATRLLLEEQPETIHVLADALAAGVLTADLYVAEIECHSERGHSERGDS